MANPATPAAVGLEVRGKNRSFQIPPPRASPLGPVAVPVLPLMVEPDTCIAPLPCWIPAPCTSAEPVSLLAVRRLPLTRLLLRMVSPVWIPSASADATPAGAVASTTFSVIEVFEIVACPG
jgi:hypothetical protein